MSKFFFRVSYRGEWHPDRVGEELVGSIAAYQHAHLVLAELEKGCNHVSVEVLDASGKAVTEPEIVHARLRRVAT